jgi:polyhydroxyalkanoate synthesis regulator phasin
MFDIVKQSVFASLGLASLARDKAEELVTEISRRAKLSEKEANEFRDELMRRRETAQKEFEAEVDRRIDHAFIQLGLIKAGVKKSIEQGRDGLQAMIDQRIQSAVDQLGLARSDDMQALAKRVERLERQPAVT